MNHTTTATPSKELPMFFYAIHLHLHTHLKAQNTLSDFGKNKWMDGWMHGWMDEMKVQ